MQKCGDKSRQKACTEAAHQAQHRLAQAGQRGAHRAAQHEGTVGGQVRDVQRPVGQIQRQGDQRIDKALFHRPLQ